MLRYLKQEGRDTAGQYRSCSFIPLLDLNHLTSANPTKSGKSPSESHLAPEQGGGKHCSLQLTHWSCAFILYPQRWVLSPEMRPTPSLLQIIFWDFLSVCFLICYLHFPFLKVIPFLLKASLPLLLPWPVQSDEWPTSGELCQFEWLLDVVSSFHGSGFCWVFSFQSVFHIK